MVGSPDDGVVDVLDTEDRRSVLAVRTRRSLAVVAAVAAVLGLLADFAIRRDESAALDRCEAEVRAATERARGRVGFMASYVRPAVAGSPPGTRADLFALVSDAARDVRGPVRSARTACEEIGVLFFHDELGRRREHLLRRVDATVRHLDAVMADGRAAYGGSHGAGDITRDSLANE